jgi:hypothetical protein
MGSWGREDWPGWAHTQAVGRTTLLVSQRVLRWYGAKPQPHCQYHPHHAHRPVTQQFRNAKRRPTSRGGLAGHMRACFLPAAEWCACGDWREGGQ